MKTHAAKAAAEARIIFDRRFTDYFTFWPANRSGARRSNPQIVIGHSTQRRRGDRTGVFGEHAAGIARFWGLPRLTPSTQLRCGEVERYFFLLRINRDAVAVTHQRQRPAGISLRRD